MKLKKIENSDKPFVVLNIFALILLILSILECFEIHWMFNIIRLIDNLF